MNTNVLAPLVAHVIYRLDVGGLENGLVNLVNGMPVHRYRHAILCLAGYSETFRTRILREDVEVLSLDKRPGNDLSTYIGVWRHLRRLRPAIVHTRNLGTIDMQWVAAVAGVPHRVHGEHGWEANDPEGRNAKALRIRRACRPVIQRYVPMSLDIARWLRDQVRVRPEHIRQIYNGVDAERFRPAMRLGHGIPSQGVESGMAEPIAIGTIARLDPIKNQLAFLQALHSMFQSDPALRSQISAAIVGDGPMRASLESEAARLDITDRIRFMGARNDVPEQLRAMDIFVLPSHNEGISNTILEAMASGLPVVAARVGGNTEVVENGVTGTLYDPHLAGALEATLKRYVSAPELRRAHGAAARVSAVQRFGLAAMVQGYLGLYDDLCGLPTQTPATDPTV